MAILRQANNTDVDSGWEVFYETGDAKWTSQTFTTINAYTLTSVKLLLWRTGSPGTITVSIRAVDGSSHPTGGDLTSGTTNGNTLPTSELTPEWREVTLTDYALSAGTEYAIVVRALSGSSANAGNWNDDFGGTYSGGIGLRSSNSGSTWASIGSDLGFETYSGGPTSLSTHHTKQLVVVGMSEVWYESSSGVMEVLSASAGTLDGADAIDIAEVYGKVFIFNGSTKKVADFQNTKIATSDLGANPPDEGTSLSGGNSSAVMVVDYITSLSSACTIYGKRTSTQTFTSGETVTGTDDDGNAISFVISANEVSAPHYYDYTVFGNDSSFGTMPDKIYIAARYRGRIMMSGNIDYPNQWYATKIGFPFNLIYNASDPLTAVAGNNTDAGLIGDTPTAIISFGDDFLVFGCADSIHLLDGDPAEGGSLNEVDPVVGIFSQTAWCKDRKSNLYFYGPGGIYMMAGGRSKPVNISQGFLPQLDELWDADPDIHRVVLTYDPFNNGIIISRTTLADGTNLNYWYDLKTEGFYPEVYPNACGIFCSYNYNSKDPDYNRLMFGCSDGYLREFKNSAKNDDAGDTDSAIQSTVALPIEKLLEDDDDKEGKLKYLVFESAGGATGGDFSGSDGFTWEVHVGNDAETVLEDIRDIETPKFTGTISGSGRSSRVKVGARGAYAGVVIWNYTAGETWVLNRVYGTTRAAGRVRA